MKSSKAEVFCGYLSLPLTKFVNMSRLMISHMCQEVMKSFIAHIMVYIPLYIYNNAHMIVGQAQKLEQREGLLFLLWLEGKEARVSVPVWTVFA